MAIVVGPGSGPWLTTTSAITTAEPWYSWNQTYATGTTTMTNVWVDWNDGWTARATTAAGSQNIWVRWTNAVPVYSMNDLARYSSPYAGEVGRDELRELAGFSRTEDEWSSIRARNEAARRDREADATRAAARAEAHKLLALVLTPAQLACYAANQYFDVVGSLGGAFRIHHGTSGNIRQLVDGQEVNRLCVHPKLWEMVDDHVAYLPTEDCLAAQALALMHDELGAVSLANVHQGVRHLRAVA